MAQNKTLDLDGKRYEFDNNGVAHEKGNASSSSSSSSTSSGSDGWSQENGKWIYKQGGQKTTGWKEISWSGGTDWFYFDGNGEMQTGWQQINWDGGNKWFYFDPTNGNMYKNTTVTIDGTSYHFDGNGVCSG